MYLKKVDQSLIFNIHYQHLEEATTKLSSSISEVHIRNEVTHAVIAENIPTYK